jgi:hypothetical protein
MQPKINNIILIIACLISSACTKKTECPAFADNELIPLIYKSSESIVFKDSQNNINEILFMETEFSKEYSFKCRDLNNICLCESYAEINVKHNESGTEFILLKIETNDRNNNVIYRFNIRDFSFEFDFENDPIHIELFDNFEMTGILQTASEQFEDVFVVTNTDIEDTSSVHKIYFNKEFGILRITDKNTLKNWDLILN